LTIDQLVDLQTLYWGGICLSAHGTDARADIAKKLFDHAEYDQKNNYFTFPDFSGICETGLLFALGFTSSRTISCYPRQWRRIRKEVLVLRGHIKDNPSLLVEISKGKTLGKDEVKKRHATAYIRWIAGSFGMDDDFEVKGGIGETIPDKSVKDKDVRVLPYDTIAQIFAEYQAHSKVCKDEPRMIAKKETFRKAFLKQTKIRLLGAKGSFQTCDICNVVNELLKKTSFTQQQRKIIMSYKTLHIEQQKAERDHLEVQKRRALEPVGSDLIPSHGLIYSDGMTVYTNNTPTGGRARKVCALSPEQ
jgi:hypothetical protein